MASAWETDTERIPIVKARAMLTNCRNCWLRRTGRLR